MYEELLSFGIKLLEPYKGAKLHHMMECQFCFHQWSSTPTQKKQSFRLNGTNGCPNCIGREVKDVVLDPVVLEPLITIDQPALKKWLSDHKDERIVISDQTGFLPENARVRQRIWHIVNGKDVPLCKGCNTEHVSWHMQENRYRDFCGSACSHKDPEVKKNLGAEKGTVTKEVLLERVNRKHGTQYTDLKEAYAARYPDRLKPPSAPQPSPLEQRAAKWKRNNPNLPIEMYYDLQDKEKFKEINSRLMIAEISQQYGVPIPTLNGLLVRHGISAHPHFVSTMEKTVRGLLDELSVEYSCNNRSILPNRRELDVFCPSKKLAIEVNGVYYHGELGGNKGKFYHLEKTNACLAMGIQLMHFMDIEVTNKWPIVKSMVTSKLGMSQVKINARECEVVEVTGHEARTFFDRCHISGFVGASVYIALKYNGMLVSMMSFGKSRFNKDHEWELIRLASELDTSVVGGASKMLAHFKRTRDPQSIVSFADKRFSANGNVYTKLGFTLVRESNPNYWYFLTKDPRRVFSRQKFQKHMLAERLNHYDIALTEWENMVANGYDRIWDCGNLVFSWIKNKA